LVARREAYQRGLLALGALLSRRGLHDIEDYDHAVVFLGRECGWVVEVFTLTRCVRRCADANRAICDPVD
jgi:hypothetical protein